MRREKSLRIGVHIANAVVWGPVCTPAVVEARAIDHPSRDPRRPVVVVVAAARRDARLERVDVFERVEERRRPARVDAVVRGFQVTQRVFVERTDAALDELAQLGEREREPSARVDVVAALCWVACESEREEVIHGE